MDELQQTFAAALSAHQSGEFTTAEKLYEEVLAATPENYDARYLLGTLQLQTNQIGEAVTNLQMVVAARPDVADAQNNLGVALQTAGNWQDAAKAFQKAIELNPDYEQAFFNLGSMMEERGLLSDAEKCFRHSVELSPDDLSLRARYAQVVKALEKWEEAEELYAELSSRDPQNTDWPINLAFIYARSGRFDEARKIYADILETQPEYYQIQNSLSYLDERTGDFAAAEARARRAIELAPDYADAYNNLGYALQSQTKFGEAKTEFQKALQLQPGFPLATLNLGCLQLLLGDWPTGWGGYALRREVAGVAPVPFSQPLWKGQTISEGTILLLAEQGLGDTLMFIRFAQLVKQRVPKVFVSCPPELKTLLATVSEIDGVLTEGDDLPEFDVYCPLPDLPGIFQTSLTTIPHQVPYLSVNPELLEEWKKKLSGKTEFQIGINWQGNPEFPRDQFRSIPLENFAPLADVSDVKLISLQHGYGEEQLANVEFAVEKLSTDARTLEETAAAMEALDLVITSDTAIAHLAGALGVNCWVAVPQVPDWRWLLDRTDSPWYPSLRLFRQTEFGNWANVFLSMQEELKTLLENAGQ